MKILHIISNLGSGGAEKMLVDIIEEMQVQGIASEVIVFSKIDMFFEEKMDALGVPVYYGKSTSIYSLSHIKLIHKIMKQNDYDCIHTHLFPPQLYTIIAMKLVGSTRPIVTTEHSTFNRRRKNKIFFLMDRWMYQQYDKIITISRATKKNLSEYLPEINDKIVTIENGIHIAHYSATKPGSKEKLHPSLTNNDKIVLMVARMGQQKDHETLIRASEILPENYRVLFVGTGERFEEVKKYALKYGRSDIIFLGERSDVPTIMATADVFVLSSKWEGFGLVVVEAAATGLPVVASDVDGLREIVQDIGGLLFPAGNENHLASQIVKTMNLEKPYQAQTIGKYSITVTVSRYIDCYKELIQEKLCL